MDMLNRCREITDAKRAELEAFDRHAQRKEQIAMRKELREQRSPEWGNRKERRRQAALQRVRETA